MVGILIADLLWPLVVCCERLGLLAGDILTIGATFFTGIVAFNGPELFMIESLFVLSFFFKSGLNDAKPLFRIGIGRTMACCCCV